MSGRCRLIHGPSSATITLTLPRKLPRTGQAELRRSSADARSLVLSSDWCKRNSDATVKRAMAWLTPSSANCYGGPAPAPGGARSFPIAANPSLCMDVASGRAVAGNRVQLWHCTGKAPQKFILEPGAGRIRFAGSNFCVEQIPGGRMLELTPAIRRATVGPTTPACHVSNSNGVCLDVPGVASNPLQQLGVLAMPQRSPQKFLMR